MFGLDPALLAIGLVVFLLLEIALFWAAASLVDAPPLRLAKTVLVGAGIGGITAVVLFFLASQTGLDARRPAADSATATFLGLGLVASWGIVAGLATPFVPVPTGKGLLLAAYQQLLRGLLYALLAGLIMVALALVEIASQPGGSRTARPAPVVLAQLAP
jgi:hypothetical protein